MPRAVQYGKVRGVRFRKIIDKELTLFCVEKEITISKAIQTAVECFLRHPKCQARKKMLEEIL